jgi:hypothetical protein
VESGVEAGGERVAVCVGEQRGFAGDLDAGGDRLSGALATDGDVERGGVYAAQRRVALRVFHFLAAGLSGGRFFVGLSVGARDGAVALGVGGHRFSWGTADVARAAGGGDDYREHLFSHGRAGLVEGASE